MEKNQAIRDYFNGSVEQCAREVGCTGAAVRQWPGLLPPRIRDRVQAALWRREEPRLRQLMEGEKESMRGMGSSLASGGATVHANSTGELA